MLNILIISGSPIKNGSTEILLHKTAEGIIDASALPITSETVRLNDYMYLPCQSCGKSPEPDYCLFQDEIYPVYEQLIDCDVVLFGSPIYFDSVSAQAKLFIDRCNCLRPYNFKEDANEIESERHFKKIIEKKRLGAFVFVGGERQEFEPARKVMAGFFKWTEIQNCGQLYFSSNNMTAGAVRTDVPIMEKAYNLGREIASKLLENDI